MTIELSLYFDGNCPFCLATMRHLQQLDQAHNQVACLAFIDISADDFDAAVLGVDSLALNRLLHSLDRQGQLLVGVDSILAAYSLVGKGYWVWPLRVPILYALMAFLYAKFAQHRYRLSRLLGYTKPMKCDRGGCEL